METRKESWASTSLNGREEKCRAIDLVRSAADRQRFGHGISQDGPAMQIYANISEVSGGSLVCL